MNFPNNKNQLYYFRHNLKDIKDLSIIDPIIDENKYIWIETSNKLEFCQLLKKESSVTRKGIHEYRSFNVIYQTIWLCNKRRNYLNNWRKIDDERGDERGDERDNNFDILNFSYFKERDKYVLTPSLLFIKIYKVSDEDLNYFPILGTPNEIEDIKNIRNYTNEKKSLLIVNNVYDLVYFFNMNLNINSNLDVIFLTNSLNREKENKELDYIYENHKDNSLKSDELKLLSYYGIYNYYFMEISEAVNFLEELNPLKIKNSKEQFIESIYDYHYPYYSNIYTFDILKPYFSKISNIISFNYSIDSTDSPYSSNSSNSTEIIQFKERIIKNMILENVSKKISYMFYDYQKGLLINNEKIYQSKIKEVNKVVHLITQTESVESINIIKDILNDKLKNTDYKYFLWTYDKFTKENLPITYKKVITTELIENDFNIPLFLMNEIVNRFGGICINLLDNEMVNETIKNTLNRRSRVNLILFLRNYLDTKSKLSGKTRSLSGLTSETINSSPLTPFTSYTHGSYEDDDEDEQFKSPLSTFREKGSIEKKKISKILLNKDKAFLYIGHQIENLLNMSKKYVKDIENDKNTHYNYHDILVVGLQGSLKNELKP